MSETSIAEIAATSDRTRRNRLLDVCKHMVYAGECIQPYNWIIEQLTQAHAKDGARFNWESLSVRGPELEEGLARRHFLGNDEIAEEIKKDFKAHGKEFEAIYKAARPV